MNNDAINDVSFAELDEVGGGLPFLALPAVVGYIDFYQLPPPLE